MAGMTYTGTRPPGIPRFGLANMTRSWGGGTSGFHWMCPVVRGPHSIEKGGSKNASTPPPFPGGSVTLRDSKSDVCAFRCTKNLINFTVKTPWVGARVFLRFETVGAAGFLPGQATLFGKVRSRLPSEHTILYLVRSASKRGVLNIVQ